MPRDKCHKERHFDKAPNNIIHVSVESFCTIKNGRCWKTAFDNLQDALVLATTVPFSEILVA